MVTDFSSQYQEIALSDFVANAKKELEAVPKFDPWRLISVERKKKRILDNQSKDDAIKDEKAFSKKYKKITSKIFKIMLVFINPQLMETLEKVRVQR